MSKYTTEVRFICENYAGYEESQPYTEVNNIIDTAAPMIFEEFPIFDENYRSVLERKILRHYYTREICAETVGLWKLWLNNKMNEIMPFYNKLYESELIKFNPMYDIDLSTMKSGNENTTQEETNNFTGKNFGISSETGSKSQNTNESENKNTIGSKSQSEIEEEESANKSFGINSKTENEKTNENKNQSEENKQLNINSKNGNSKTDEENENNKTDASYVIGNNNTITDGNNTNTNKNAFSDTPQGNLTDVENGNYLSDYRKIDEQGNTHTQTGANSVENSNGNTNERGNKTASNEENGTEINNTFDNKNVEGSNNSDNSKSGNEIKNESSSTNKSNKNENNETEIFNERNSNTGNSAVNDSKNRITNDNKNETATKQGNIGTTEQYIEKITGKRGGVSYSKMLNEFRKTFLNIDAMVINELADMFITVY